MDENHGRNSDQARPPEELEKRIGHRFENKELLRTALTHSSYCNENRKKNGCRCNERLEFLGGSILSLVTAQYLFGRYKEQDEGFLTKTRASLVCENALAEYAAKIDLGAYIQLGHGEVVGNGRARKSIVADAFEALLAAIYLDSDLNTVRGFLLPFLERLLESLGGAGTEDFKSRLQQIAQQAPEEELRYEMTGEEGPPHDRVFHAAVYLNSNLLGQGSGKSKREAEQSAARQALALFEETDGRTP